MGAGGKAGHIDRLERTAGPDRRRRRRIGVVPRQRLCQLQIAPQHFGKLLLDRLGQFQLPNGFRSGFRSGFRFGFRRHFHPAMARGRDPAFGAHHARLGHDLQRAVDLEAAVGYHQLAGFKPGTDDVVVPGPGAKHNLAPFESGPAPVRQPDIYYRALAGLQRGRGRNHQRRGGAVFRAGIAKRLSADQRHPADVAGAGFIFDDFRMHGADPFAGQVLVQDFAVLGQAGPNNRPHKHAGLEPACGVVDIDPDRNGPGLFIKNRIDKSDLPRKHLAGIGLGKKLYRLAVAEPDHVRFVSLEPDPHP